MVRDCQLKIEYPLTFHHDKIRMIRETTIPICISQMGNWRIKRQQLLDMVARTNTEEKAAITPRGNFKFKTNF